MMRNVKKLYLKVRGNTRYEAQLHSGDDDEAETDAPDLGATDAAVGPENDLERQCTYVGHSAVDPRETDLTPFEGQRWPHQVRLHRNYLTRH